MRRVEVGKAPPEGACGEPVELAHGVDQLGVEVGWVQVPRAEPRLGAGRDHAGEESVEVGRGACDAFVDRDPQHLHLVG